MFILQLLMFLAPGFFACMYYYNVRKKSLSSVNYFVTSLLFSFLITIFSIVMMLLLNGNIEIAKVYSDFKGVVTFSTFAVVGAAILPNILLLFSIGKKEKSNE